MVTLDGCIIYVDGMAHPHLTRSRWAAIGAAVAVTLGGGGLIGVTAADGTGSAFTPVPPTRILDTRSGQPVSGATIAVQVTGDLVPAGAVAATVNLTVTGGVRDAGYGFVTAYPCLAATDPPPNASTINFVEGVDVANSTTVPLGATGKMCLNVFGTAHLLVDVAGYLAPAPTVDAFSKAETVTAIADAVDGKADRSDLDDLMVTVSDIESELSAVESGLSALGSATDTELDAKVDRSALDATTTHLVARSVATPVTVATGVGDGTSLAIAATGSPILAWTDTSTDELVVTACTDPHCSTARSTVIDETTGLSQYVAMAIGHDGNPVIAYRGAADPSSPELRVAACSDPTCEGDVTITSHGRLGAILAHLVAIAVRHDGTPVIAFQDNQYRVAVLSCDDAACTEGSLSNVDEAGLVALGLGLAIGWDGNPVIAIQQWENRDGESAFSAALVVCNDPDCAGDVDEAVQVLHDSDHDSDPGTDLAEVGGYAVVTIGIDRNPVVAYRVGADGPADTSGLHLARCDSPTCENSTWRRIAGFGDDGSDDDGYEIGIGIGADGFPTISHVDLTSSVVELVQCGDLGCTDPHHRIRSIVSDGEPGPRESSLAFGVDGIPVIAYQSEDESRVRLAFPWWVATNRR
jgi:hypothetical protein